MNHISIPRSTSRARWLAELSAALDDAQSLLARLVAERIDQGGADHLRMRIEELRTELRSLHRQGFAASRVIEPPRLGHSDWQPKRDQTPSGRSPPPPNGSMNGPIAGASHPAVAQKPGFKKAFLP